MNNFNIFFINQNQGLFDEIIITFNIEDAKLNDVLRYVYRSVMSSVMYNYIDIKTFL